MTALRGVVVDHIEDHFDARRVQGFDHGPELLHLLAVRAAGRITVVRSEEADRVVAPVIREALLDEPLIVDELVHRHEFDRGDAELHEVLDDHRVPDPGVRSAQVLGQLRVPHRQTLDVGFVDDRLVVRDVGEAVVAPVEVGVHDDGLGHERRRVERGDLVRVVPVVAVHRGIPLDVAVDRLGVRVDQQLRRVAPLPVGGVVGTVDPVSVPLTGLHSGDVRVPHVRVDLMQLDSLFGAGGVEQAQLHLRRDLGEQREVCAGPVVGRAQRVSLARPDLHEWHLSIICRRRPALSLIVAPAELAGDEPTGAPTPAPARARPVAAPAAGPKPAIRAPDAGRLPRSLPSCPRRTRRTPRRLC